MINVVMFSAIAQLPGELVALSEGAMDTFSAGGVVLIDRLFHCNRTILVHLDAPAEEGCGRMIESTDLPVAEFFRSESMVFDHKVRF